MVDVYMLSGLELVNQMCFDFKYAITRNAQNIDPELIFKLESLL